MISSDQIRVLYDRYLELIKLEVEVFHVKPTEVRHLIGRLGEFHCALAVEGTLAHMANQQGFDVIGKDGRRISVKTTAQKSGFVPISSKTIDQVDDLMIIQYANGELSIVYHGCVHRAVEAARFYQHVGNYELDIAKARKLTLHEKTTEA